MLGERKKYINMNWLKNINTEILTSKQIKGLFIAILVLITLNISLSFLVHDVSAQNLAGETLSETKWRNSFIRTNLYGAWIIGFILATIVSLIPFKKLSYDKKYLPFSIIIIFILYSFIFIGLVRIMLLRA